MITHTNIYLIGLIAVVLVYFVIEAVKSYKERHSEDKTGLFIN